MTRPRAAAGFTLLEVLVALAILSLTVVVSIQGFAAGLRLLRLSGEHQEAVLLADQKAREIVQPTVGHEQGTEGVYTWERTTKAIEAPDLVVPGRLSAVKVYEIDVQVKWGERRVQVATLRTVADTDQPVLPGAPRQ
ncbi:MAG TPA: prepilin-type N-terminal cleavage/methylation domain-containing protein [Methylomirabilota bacterium]|jgi:general secretion pathway protein I|nr:prepilin-type N-terminal cleavage/methylation domain-containing protein [Methylomirabilota bacterium]